MFDFAAHGPMPVKFNAASAKNRAFSLTRNVFTILQEHEESSCHRSDPFLSMRHLMMSQKNDGDRQTSKSSYEFTATTNVTTATHQVTRLILFKNFVFGYVIRRWFILRALTEGNPNE